MIEVILIILSAAVAVIAVVFQAALFSLIKNNLRFIEKYLSSAIILVSGVAYLASGILSNRNLQFASFAVNSVDLETSPYIGLISRLSNLFLLTIGGGFIFTKIVEKSWRLGNKVNQNELDGGGVEKILLLLISIVLMYFVSQIFGTEGGFEQKPIYLTISLVAILLSTRESQILGLHVAKYIIFIYLLTSIMFLVIDGSRVLAPGYRGIIPGFEYRFWGLAPHANAIGPLAALLIFLEISVPSNFFTIRLILYVVGILVMLISQSKTSIGAALIGLFLTPFFNFDRSSIKTKKFRLSTRHAVFAGSLFLIVLSVLIISTMGMPKALGSLLSKITGAVDIDTMSGRSEIWRVALREFYSNPLFGYGLGIWGSEFRAAVGLNYAYHAHNQLLQSMSESGVCGVVGLLIFFASSMRYCIQASALTFGGSIGIFVLFFFRCITEAPLKVSGIGTGETLLLLVLISIWGVAYKNHSNK